MAATLEVDGDIQVSDHLPVAEEASEDGRLPYAKEVVGVCIRFMDTVEYLRQQSSGGSTRNGPRVSVPELQSSRGQVMATSFAPCLNNLCSPVPHALQ